MTERANSSALGELQALLGELATTLRQVVPKIRALEAEAFPGLPPEMEELEDLAPYPESVRRGLDLVAAERLPSLVALLEALASATPANPNPDEVPISEIWRSLDPTAPPLPPPGPSPQLFEPQPPTALHLEEVLEELTTQADVTHLAARLDRLESRLRKPRRNSDAGDAGADDELVARTRAAFQRVLSQLPKPRLLTREEVEAWLARPFDERWAEVPTARPPADHAMVFRLLEAGAEPGRPAQTRRELGLWALAVVASTEPRPEPRPLWIDHEARAWALLALAAAETGELARAEFAVAEAWVQLERGSGDPHLIFEVGLPSFLLDWKQGRNRHFSPLEMRLFTRAVEDPRLDGELLLWQALYEEMRGNRARAQHTRRGAAARLGERRSGRREAQLRQLLVRLKISPAPTTATEEPDPEPTFEVH